MTHYERLNDLIDAKDGMVLVKDVERHDIPRKYLSLAVREGYIERVSPGVYLAASAFDDPMYRIQTRYTKAIFSHATALFLHGLTDRDPLSYVVTVPSDYNAPRLKDLVGHLFYAKRELHEVGLVDGHTFQGRKIRTYDMERTLCDMVRSRNKLDVGLVSEAVKRYLMRKDKDIPKLMQYAAKFRVQSIMRKYLEVLL